MGCGGSAPANKDRHVGADPPKPSEHSEHSKPSDPSDPADATRFKQFCTLPLHDKDKPVAAAAIRVTDPKCISDILPPEFLEGKKVHNEFCAITLSFDDGKPEDEGLFEKLKELEGTSIELKPTHIVMNEKVAAIGVCNNDEFPCQDAHPHILVATAPDATQEDIDDVTKKGKIEIFCARKLPDLPPDITIPGEFRFMHW